ncbi:Chromatin-remodeling ATPase INO80, partial [Frankliniella fusca]
MEQKAGTVPRVPCGLVPSSEESQSGVTPYRITKTTETTTNRGKKCYEKILCVTVNTVLGLQCYNCSEQPVQLNPNKTVPLCSDFDESWRYVVDCPHSTFCRKTSVELSLANGKVIKSVKRDCAPQLHSFQVLENRNWVHKNETLTDIYTEGCGKQDTGADSTSAEYCYCRSYLCNSSKSSHDSSYSHHSDAMA